MWWRLGETYLKGVGFPTADFGVPVFRARAWIRCMFVSMGKKALVLYYVAPRRPEQEGNYAYL